MRRAFTLIELSIVLIIIGLLTGGIITSRNIIRQATLQSVMREIEEYKGAVYTFKLQYGETALPGDFAHATDYWGSTGNGDGNGMLTAENERLDFWQHLSLSNIIVGDYTGVAGSGANTYNAANMPLSAYNNGYYLGVHVSSGDNYYGMNYLEVGNFFYFGARDTTRAGMPTAELLSARDAENIDIKFDDGIPDHGHTWVLKGHDLSDGDWGDNCVANEVSGSDDAGDYDFSTDAAACRMWFRF